MMMMLDATAKTSRRLCRHHHNKATTTWTLSGGISGYQPRRDSLQEEQKKKKTFPNSELGAGFGFSVVCFPFCRSHDATTKTATCMYNTQEQDTTHAVGGAHSLCFLFSLLENGAALR